MAVRAAPIFALLLVLIVVATTLPTASAQRCPTVCTSRRAARRACRRQRFRGDCQLRRCRVCRRVRRRLRGRRVVRRVCSRRWACVARRGNDDDVGFVSPVGPPGVPQCRGRCTRRGPTAASCRAPCSVIPCVYGRRNRRRRGYRCKYIPVIVPQSVAPVPTNAAPSTTPSAAASPSSQASQSAFPSPPPFPVDTAAIPPADFIAAVRTQPQSVSRPSTTVSTSTGQTFNVAVTASTRAQGVTNLKSQQGRVQLQCRPDGSLQVRMSGTQAAGLTVADLFPIGSLIVVEFETFGTCRFSSPEVASAGETPVQRAQRIAREASADQRNGYLIVTSTTGTLADFIVRGTKATYFNMFEGAQVSVSQVTGATRMIKNMVGHVAKMFDLTPVSKQSAQIGSAVSFSGPFGVSGTLRTSFSFTRGTINVSGGAVSATYEYSQSSSVTFNFDASYTGTPQLSSDAVASATIEQDVPIIPGLPPLIVEAEAPITVFSSGAITAGSLGLSGSVTVDLGTRQISATVGGSPLAPTLSATFSASTPSGSATVTPNVGAACAGTVGLTVYPCLFVFIDDSYVYTGARLDVDATCTTSTIPALSPVGGSILAACQVCHTSEATTGVNVVADQQFRYADGPLSFADLDAVPLATSSASCFVPAVGQALVNGVCTGAGVTPVAATVTPATSTPAGTTLPAISSSPVPSAASSPGASSPVTPSVSPTAAVSGAATPTVSASSSATGSVGASPSASNSVGPTPSATSSVTPSLTPTPTNVGPTPTPTSLGALSLSATPEPSSEV